MIKTVSLAISALASVASAQEQNLRGLQAATPSPTPVVTPGPSLVPLVVDTPSKIAESIGTIYRKTDATNAYNAVVATDNVFDNLYFRAGDIHKHKKIIVTTAKVTGVNIPAAEKIDEINLFPSGKLFAGGTLLTQRYNTDAEFQLEYDSGSNEIKLHMNGQQIWSKGINTYPYASLWMYEPGASVEVRPNQWYEFQILTPQTVQTSASTVYRKKSGLPKSYDNAITTDVPVDTVNFKVDTPEAMHRAIVLSENRLSLSELQAGTGRSFVAGLFPGGFYYYDVNSGAQGYIKSANYKNSDQFTLAVESGKVYIYKNGSRVRDEKGVEHSWALASGSSRQYASIMLYESGASMEATAEVKNFAATA